MNNVAIVVLDTLRKDAFDKYFEWLPGRTFENAWSPSSWTAPVHAAMFSGQYPSEVGTHVKNEVFDYDQPVLSEVLAQNGYHTKAFSCNPVISDTFDFDRGFNQFDGNWRLKKRSSEIFDWNKFITETQNEGVTRYVRAVWRCVTEDSQTIPSLHYGLKLKLRDMGLSTLAGIEDDGAAESLKWIRQNKFDDEEFLFINLMEAHAPYDPPSEYETTNLKNSPSLLGCVSDSNADPELLRQSYDDSVHYLSDMYKKIFEELTSNFDYIVTLGDHGEMFGEMGIWGHAHSVHPELTHVPLSIYGEELGGSTDKLVSLLDVHKTVLDLADCDAPSRGQNLLNDPQSREYLTERFGLNERRRSALRDAGISKEAIDRHDTTLRGIAIPESYYGHQMLDTFSEHGESPVDNPEGRVQELVNELDLADVSVTSGEDIPEEVHQRLQDLGYA